MLINIVKKKLTTQIYSEILINQSNIVFVTGVVLFGLFLLFNMLLMRNIATNAGLRYVFINIRFL